MSSPSDLAEAFRLLVSDPARSELLCRAHLVQQDDPGARLLLAGALREQGKFADAHALTRALSNAHPNWAGAVFEHGLVLARLQRHAEALDVLQRAERLGPLPGVWREIGDQYWALGDRAAAEGAYLRHLASQAPEALIHEAVTALRGGDKAGAEQRLRRQLARHPGDVLAMRLLAEHLSAADRYGESEALLRACLERTPSFALARYGLAMVLVHDHRVPPALEQLDLLLRQEPGRFEYLNLKADALGRLGEFEAAAACLEQIIAEHPAHAAQAWSNYGHILRALGRRAACEAAYKRAIELGATGEAYWGLANLKTYQFLASDIAAMRALAARPDLVGESKTALLFALGKALEDERDYAGAFAAYAEANAHHRARITHSDAERQDAVRRARRVFTPSFFAERQGLGAIADDPIFIVGMPRSGSTLVEQIIASHSRVEGTQELVELLAIAKRMEREGRYPELLSDMGGEALRALGEEYLERARAFRKTDAPRFIDKMPNNFTQIGLIHLILPRARIVDVRRHPLACCFSIFKQHWASGQTFAYKLEEIGAFYRAYVELMAHFDAVLPGRVHRVIYEDLVAHPEAEIRRLLEACGLAFEEQCLRFYENKRPVRTPSSEQVRRPINTEGLEAWKPFEHWLGPLKDALGPVLDLYPAAPPLKPV